MSRLFFDTNLFIYWLEDSGPNAEKVFRLAQRMQERRDTIVTSTLTLGEVLVKPLEKRQQALAAQYEAMWADPAIDVIAFDKACARTFANIRLDRAIAPPDAIQLSCAVAGRCNLFITSDDRLSKKTVPGIDFIASLDKAVDLL
jgi:predicted nucleic acid-binding protein